jgi:molecular chaperone DnaK
MPNPVPPPFDPYAGWLGIPPGVRPPDHYALLGLPRAGADPGRVEAAFRARYTAVRKYQLRWPDLATRLLDELSMASVCLTDPARKAEYDRTLNHPKPQRIRGYVGIDLGTKFSSLAYVDDKNEVHSLRAEGDRNAIASAVYFPGPEELDTNVVMVGTEALNYSLLHPDRLARAFQRHMGDDAYRFECHGRAYRAEEPSALVLKKLLSCAANAIGPVEEAVISVPAYFDKARRRATVAAGKIAGLRRVELIDESKAAALAYGHTAMTGGLFADAELTDLYGQDAILLVYDLGGETFDVTIVRYDRDGKFETLAADGDVTLGSDDWDAVLLEYVARGYYGQPGEPDPARSARREFPFTEGLRARDPSALQHMLLSCVAARNALSERPRAEVVFERHGTEHKVTVTRVQFQQMTAHLASRTVAATAGLLDLAGISWSNPDRILLKGEGSRMPMIREMLTRAAGRPLDFSLSPDTAIAEGAALHAALRFRGRPEVYQDPTSHGAPDRVAAPGSGSTRRLPGISS